MNSFGSFKLCHWPFHRKIWLFQIATRKYRFVFPGLSNWPLDIRHKTLLRNLALFICQSDINYLNQCRFQNVYISFNFSREKRKNCCPSTHYLEHQWWTETLSLFSFWHKVKSIYRFSTVMLHVLHMVSI